MRIVGNFRIGANGKARPVKLPFVHSNGRDNVVMQFHGPDGMLTVELDPGAAQSLAQTLDRLSIASMHRSRPR